ncbi:hypothetical protein A3B18_03685 [Candidatus Giovannonibacteria bacterium RIFCSPLOWO2_01_FULL_46_13]|uniref:RNA polymerase sigma factor n=1 Tax=Candidatus Giovannonibacteria bacterium RIFCSPLOWO2_01_FULL_46_13 TaxID=1798352 RepID=A0A1F5X3F4_9BACT|nr:MAG: hypothetical protein A3B18_03685 [Candidatus Giovannonibacteria bacterium RIFCSPLOWO2_01_FULL_46_13]
MKEKDFLAAYEAYSEALFRHCYFRIYDREKAKDMVQETFIRTWEYILKGEKVENIRAFFYRVLNNLVVDEIRRKKSLSLEEITEGGFQASDNKVGKLQVELGAEAVNLMRSMEKMEEEKKQLLIMRFIDGLGPKEIASVVGESENVISVRLSRALKELREIFNNG